MAIYQYKIATGWNVASGSLVNIETIKATGDVRPFGPPDADGGYDDGILRIKGDGTGTLAGWAVVAWKFKSITKNQRYYLYYTINGGSLIGKVTINTVTTQPGTYTRYNALMVLPKLRESQKNFRIFENYIVLMTRLTTPS